MNGKVLLDLCGEWTLHDYPDTQAEQYAAVFTMPGDVKKRLPPPLSAVVPGTFVQDFQRVGRVPPVYDGSHMLLMEKFEYTHFVYVKDFWFAGVPTGDEFICFDGIDTVAAVYLNGVELGRMENMFIAHELAAPSLQQGENQLAVHIEPAVLMARRANFTLLNKMLRYNYDALPLRKSCSQYGWDIMPRMLTAGLWRPVRLMCRPKVRFSQTYLYTQHITEDQGLAQLCFFYELELQREPAYDYAVEITGRCGESSFSCTRRVWGKANHIGVSVKNPQLWWPRGYGEPKLYQVTARLLKNGQPVDERTWQTGIRTVELLRTDVVNEQGEGEFLFRVNRQPIFILGTNWVPPDADPALGDQRAEAVLALAEDIGCNAIRVWGGGRYEQESFYTLCDQKGFLVWQDFMMACGNYLQTEEFKQELQREIVWVVRQLRHHPCILLWSGDNECDQNYLWQLCRVDANENVLTRQLIPSLLLQEDYTRPYLPSSPYYSPGYYSAKERVNLPEEHLWGDRRYFKMPYYKDAAALFASEIGYHGCPAPKTLASFLSPDKLWDYHNEEWLLHASSPDPQAGEPFAYRNNLMAEQVRILFGHEPAELERFALASQISQAEAMQFFIQHFRGRKGHCTGIIWWNICDGWPQISDAVVDYYFRRKLAYSYIRRCQNPVCLMVEERCPGELHLVGVNDSDAPQEISYTIRQADGTVICTGVVCLPTDQAVTVTVLPAPEEQQLWRLEWDGAFAGCNSYLAGAIPFSLDLYLEQAQKLELLELQGFAPILSEGR